MIAWRAARKAKGRAALRTGARVVMYEYWMLKEGLRLLASLQQGSPQANMPLKNIAIEVTLIHARNLLEFFTAGGRSNDVKMSDFLATPPRVALPYLRRSKKRINRKLAHPSYSNSRMSSTWDFGAIQSEVDASIRRFLERLERDEPQLRKLFEEF
jgi:hypothetical protein